MAERIRLLHVDDEPNFADMTAAFLKREHEGLDITTATSANQALTVLKEAADTSTAEPFDCVISDHDMPEINGLEFLETLRETHSDLPFVLFTGRSSEKIASEAITAGVDEYMNKSGGTEQYAVLANRVSNLVTRYRAERELRSANEQLQTLYNGVTDAIYVVDEEWRITRLNARAGQLSGQTASELLGEDVREQFAAAAETNIESQLKKPWPSELLSSSKNITRRLTNGLDIG